MVVVMAEIYIIGLALIRRSAFAVPQHTRARINVLSEEFTARRSNNVFYILTRFRLLKWRRWMYC